MENGSMKIVLDFTVFYDRQVLGGFRKEFESDLVPVPGMDINDSAWHDERRIVNTTLIFSENEYYVTLESVKLSNPENFKQESEMYKNHGWKKLGEI
jgi:hypothetical protein